MKYKSIQSIDIENLRRIESIFSEIPEDELIRECINQSQFEYFLYLKDFFTQISKGISNYFSGKPLFEGVDQTQRTTLEIELEQWLSFYCLLQWGWDYITDEAKRKKYIIESSPGEMLKTILGNHAESTFAIHQASYSEFSPRKAYKQLGLLPKIEGILGYLENGGNLKDLKEEDIKILKDFINDFKHSSQKSEIPKSELNGLFNFCISVFHKNRNKTRIKHKYKDYLRIQSERETSMMKSWHPRARQPGWKIIRQEILPLT